MNRIEDVRSAVQYTAENLAQVAEKPVDLVKTLATTAMDPGAHPMRPASDESDKARQPEPELISRTQRSGTHTEHGLTMVAVSKALKTLRHPRNSRAI